jgi:pimeloyl-ACP methyl ester carboxylesterase
VVVVEGFGYGYADMRAPDRTVQNIFQELHVALAGAEVEGPYVLAGHSLAGFYILDYVNRHPGEVSAVIGTDTTAPAFAAGRDEAPASGGIPWGRLAASTGLLRWTLLAAPDLALPATTAHTAQEREQINRMTVWNFANPAVTDQTRPIGDNARVLGDVKFPRELPVLMLLAQDTVNQTNEWLPSHEEQLRAVDDHKLIVLDGGHYLHWIRSPEIAVAITDFLSEHGVTPRKGIERTSSATAG